jgi:hypothetical protein
VILFPEGADREEDQDAAHEEEETIKQVGDGLNVEIGVRKYTNQPDHEKDASQCYEGQRDNVWQ